MFITMLMTNGHGEWPMLIITCRKSK